jgi:hypothetical protein
MPLTRMREALFDEIDRLRNGQSDAKQANALVRRTRTQLRRLKTSLALQRAAAKLQRNDREVAG